jgi:SAM-dependent methyltransferase
MPSAERDLQALPSPVPSPAVWQDPEVGDVEQLWDLHHLARAHRLIDWTAENVHRHARGAIAEVGAGIGTYSERLLARGARELLLLEPDDICADVLQSRFGDDPRVVVSEDQLPDSPLLRERAGSLDAVISQNVIEHIEDDYAAVAAMAASLRPGGVMSLQVPANPSLYNELDRVYGHYRRYDERRLRDVVTAAGLDVIEVRHFNLLGVLGWVANRNRSKPRVGPRSLAVYEALVKAWRPVEDRFRPRRGLSLIIHAAKR